MASTALLFDNDPDREALLRGWLQSHHWQVESATTLEAAFAFLATHPTRLCIVSTRSLSGTAFDWIYRVRRVLPRGNQPILLAIAPPDEPADRSRALESGADAVLRTPVALEHLDQLIATLASRQPTPDEMLVRFWGVRGSIPTPGPQTVRVGGNTSCVEIRSEGELIILDAGTGIRVLGLHLQEEFQSTPLEATLLISHTHWDHIQGFPFFAPAYQPGNRLRILGYEGSKRGLEGTLSGQMESAYFPVSLRSIPSELEFREMQELSFQIGRVAVEAAFAHHPGICMGYRLQTNAGSVVYLPDHEVYSRESILQMAKFEHTANSEELADHARERDEKIIRFIQQADLLIMDSQYLAEEYPEHVGWGHSCVDDVVETAVAGGVKRLRLFHHDPAHDDTRLEVKLEAARETARKLGSTMEIELAREGESIHLRH